MTSVLDFSTPAIIPLVVNVFSAIFLFVFYCPFVSRVKRRRQACKLTAENNNPVSASIIIYSQNETAQLESLLPAVLSQDYGGLFEVIVVNEGESADVRNAVGALQLSNRNLYLTFTPDGARNLSRKKLALTLGIKAARHEVVVLTTASAIISSPLWLNKIMRNFSDPSTGIVLGYAAPSEDTKLNRKYSYIIVENAIAWLSAAIGHRPFRGDELNLAYRRKLFFENKGFSRSLNLHFGDDDIFISEIANRHNTVVELSTESIVRYGSYDLAATLRDTAIRHRFTRRFIHHMPLPILPLGECSLWSQLLSTCAICVFYNSNLYAVIASSVLTVLSLIDVAISWRKATSVLEVRRLTLTAPWFTLVEPLRRLSLYIYSRVAKQKKYTWD